MAKIGEGDPRWIVSDRQDGTNVGNWHWTEKNIFPWVKQRVEELFKGAKIVNSGGANIKITKIDKIEGEASINVRKGKVFHIYEFEIQLLWKGKFQGQVVEGSIKYPEISFEYDKHEVSISITNNSSSELYPLIKGEGLKTCNTKLSTLLSEIKNLQGEIKPTDVASPLSPSTTTNNASNAPTNNITNNAATNNTTTTNNTTATNTATNNTTAKAVTPNITLTKTFKSDWRFRARSSDIYESILDPRRVQAYTQSEAKIEGRVGGSFELYGGNIKGLFLELDPNKKIVQKWRTSTWPESHFSTVVMKFEDTSEGCKLSLEQEGIPDGEVERIKQAWSLNIFDRMKRVFGFGSSVPF